MRLSASLLVIGASLLSQTSAFAPVSSSSQKPAPTASSNSALFISSWGTKGPPSRWTPESTKKNPADDVQNYIPPPEPVDARINIDGSVLVSGLVSSSDRTDQTIFDFINSEVSAFEYDTIVAFCDDIKFSKKRLLSRSARYTGLLDKLDFVQANEAGALPTVEQLGGIKGWVAYLEGDDLLSKVKEVASTVTSATDVENVAILLVGAHELDPAAAKEAVEALEAAATARDGKLEYTLVAVGTLSDDTPEGSVPYKYAEFASDEGVIPAKASFSRAEALRLVTELLQLDAGINRTLSFTEVYETDAPEYKLIKGLRAAGYPRPTEVDFMINSGVDDYARAIEEYKESDGMGTSDNWWEDEKFQKIIREREEERKSVYSSSTSTDVEEIKDARTLEVESIAKEWAKREYFRKSMESGVDLSEEEFIESVWDRAMFEGDLKYRQAHGEVTDEETELEDFKARQAKKKEAMLARAKAELAEVLEEEDLGGKDLEEKLSKLEASDDDTEA